MNFLFIPLQQLPEMFDKIQSNKLICSLNNVHVKCKVTMYVCESQSCVLCAKLKVFSWNLNHNITHPSRQKQVYNRRIVRTMSTGI